MKTVHLEYVAMIREATGKRRESLTTSAADLAALYEEIVGRYGLPWPRHALRPSLNERMTGWETTLTHDDRVLFLPPSSGG